MSRGPGDDDGVPARVREYADQAVAYVRRSLGLTLEYDSDTLPLLDHYLRNVSELGDDKPATIDASSTAPSAGRPRALHTIQLVVVTAGAYFGEVVRRRLGGRWELQSEDVEWRLVLPTGLNFAPAGFVAAAVAQADLDDLDSELDAPPRMRPYVQQALSRMGEVSVEDYYSLCGRLDTLEHVHEILVAVAAQMMGTATELDDVVPEAVSDEPSGGVN